MPEFFQPDPEGQDPRIAYIAAECWESGAIAGRLAWTNSLTGGGTGTMVGLPVHPSLNCAVLVLGAGSSLRQGLQSWNLSNACRHRVDWRVAVSDIPTAIQPFNARVGVSDNALVDPSNGIVVTASALSANWILRAFAGAVPATPVDTGVPIVADPLAAAPVHFSLLLTPDLAMLEVNGVPSGIIPAGVGYPDAAAFWGTVVNVRKDLVTLGVVIPSIEVLSFYEQRLEGAALYP